MFKIVIYLTQLYTSIITLVNNDYQLKFIISLASAL